MSTLRSATDELRMQDLRPLVDQEIASDLDEIERATRVLEAERARRLAEFERRRAYAEEGFLSLSSWLVARHRVAPSTATRRVRVARSLRRMPHAAEAYAAGALSEGAISLLTSAAAAHPEAFARAEEPLLQAAQSLPVSGLRSVIEYWSQAQDLAGAEVEEDRRFERRHLNVSPTIGGMVRVDGDLDPEAGQALMTAIRAVMDADTRARGTPELRGPAARRADALGEICRSWLDAEERPRLAGERPHVEVLVDLEALTGRVGRSELADAGPITPEAARRLACDAKVGRVITDGPSQPLELGRSTKVITPALRRAVTIRDRGCRFPGCGRPPGWCDAHHVIHWADGGETSLSNLVLLCRPHHRAVHRGFGIEMIDGQPLFSRSDGTPLEEVQVPP